MNRKLVVMMGLIMMGLMMMGCEMVRNAIIPSAHSEVISEESVPQHIKGALPIAD
jgi:hypothetical protein